MHQQMLLSIHVYIISYFYISPPVVHHSGISQKPVLPLDF